MTGLRIAYLLADTSLAGGIRVAVGQGDALVARGHAVTMITLGDPLTWRESHAKWLFIDSLQSVDLTQFDFVVGTFWKTLQAAWEIAGKRTVHLCQGYEGEFTIYHALKDQIDAAYRLPVPKITVSPHLVDICRRFYDDATYVGQIVDAIFYQQRLPRDSARLRVLLVGPAQADFKGIDVGYAAIRRARERGATFDLVRVSQWPPAENEPTALAEEFLVGLDTREMAQVVASCDVCLAPSLHQEGFGLPAAEALASGVPTVLSQIPSFTSWDVKQDYALFAPERNGAAMGDALVRLLNDEPLRRGLAARGREVVEQFRGEKMGLALERYFSERLQRR
jgi:glycosyltransferase involved in cell wall biosynthesis